MGHLWARTLRSGHALPTLFILLENQNTGDPTIYLDLAEKGHTPGNGGKIRQKELGSLVDSMQESQPGTQTIW